MNKVWNSDPKVIFRWIALDEGLLEKLGFPSHPPGRYVNLDDLKYSYEVGAAELGDLISAIEEDE